MTPPKKRMYDFRIVEWQVFTLEEQERIYMQLLTSENLEVSDSVRKLILEQWPELAHKLVLDLAFHPSPRARERARGVPIQLRSSNFTIRW